jgi:hypothetical protein
MKNVVEPCLSSLPRVGGPSVLVESEPSRRVEPEPEPSPFIGRRPRRASAARDDHRRSRLRGESADSGTSSCRAGSLSGSASSYCRWCAGDAGGTGSTSGGGDGASVFVVQTAAGMVVVKEQVANPTWPPLQVGDRLRCRQGGDDQKEDRRHRVETPEDFTKVKDLISGLEIVS